MNVYQWAIAIIGGGMTWFLGVVTVLIVVFSIIPNTETERSFKEAPVIGLVVVIWMAILSMSFALLTKLMIGWAA